MNYKFDLNEIHDFDRKEKESITEYNERFSEEQINQISKTFSSILFREPLSFDQPSLDFFHFLHENILFTNVSDIIIPKISPFTIYGRLSYYIENVKEEKIHFSISRIVSILTTKVIGSCSEFQKHNLLGSIKSFMKKFKFPYSYEHLLQVAYNFISDPTFCISQSSHNQFSVRYLIATIESFKSGLNELLRIGQISEAESDKLGKSNGKTWLKCIYQSLKLFPKDVTQIESIVIIYESKRFFTVIKGDENLSRLLCDAVSILLDHNYVNFSDFNQLNYPSLFCELSACENVLIKADAFYIIGRLVEIDRFPIDVDFSDFFRIVVRADENTNQHLLAKAFFACGRFMKNQRFAQSAFERVSCDIEKVISCYDWANFAMKEEIVSFLAIYLSCVKNTNAEFINQNFTQIFELVSLLLDFIVAKNQSEKICAPLEAVADFINFAVLISFSHDDIACLVSRYRETLDSLDGVNDKLLQQRISDLNKIIIDNFTEHES